MNPVNYTSSCACSSLKSPRALNQLSRELGGFEPVTISWVRTRDIAVIVKNFYGNLRILKNKQLQNFVGSADLT